MVARSRSERIAKGDGRTVPPVGMDRNTVANDDVGRVRETRKTQVQNQHLRHRKEERRARYIVPPREKRDALLREDLLRATEPLNRADGEGYDVVDLEKFFLQKGFAVFDADQAAGVAGGKIHASVAVGDGQEDGRPAFAFGRAEF